RTASKTCRRWYSAGCRKSPCILPWPCLCPRFPFNLSLKALLPLTGPAGPTDDNGIELDQPLRIAKALDLDERRARHHRARDELRPDLLNGRVDFFQIGDEIRQFDDVTHAGAGRLEKALDLRKYRPELSLGVAAPLGVAIGLKVQLRFGSMG